MGTISSMLFGGEQDMIRPVRGHATSPCRPADETRSPRPRPQERHQHPRVQRPAVRRAEDPASLARAVPSLAPRREPADIQTQTTLDHPRNAALAALQPGDPGTMAPQNRPPEQAHTGRGMGCEATQARLKSPGAAHTTQQQERHLSGNKAGIMCSSRTPAPVQWRISASETNSEGLPSLAELKVATHTCERQRYNPDAEHQGVVDDLADTVQGSSAADQDATTWYNESRPRNMADHNVGDSILEFIERNECSHLLVAEPEYQSMLTAYLTEMINRDSELAKRHLCVLSDYKVEFESTHLYIQRKIDILVRKAQGANNFVVIEASREREQRPEGMHFEAKHNQLVCNMLAVALHRVIDENHRTYRDLRLLGVIMVNAEAHVYTLRFSKTYLEAICGGMANAIPQPCAPHQQRLRLTPKLTSLLLTLGWEAELN